MTDTGTLLTIAAGTDAPALTSLGSWLDRTRAKAERGRSRALPARDGTTMNAVATIGVVISSVTGIANVLIAYGNWRRARPQAPAITVTVGAVTVSADDPEALAKLTRALTAENAA
ncbi:hypothetical protein [Actinoplanes sp. NPDC051859]|uniref:effector-associated constant component EACC1 n=1 Tax=Actinoplanes sp. NPDC051859 TaxID=3363909 RepID=UPI0037BD0E0E